MNHLILGCTITTNATEQSVEFQCIDEALEMIESFKRFTKRTIDSILTITVQFKENRVIHAHSMDPIEYWENEVDFKTFEDYVYNGNQAW